MSTKKDKTKTNKREAKAAEKASAKKSKESNLSKFCTKQNLTSPTIQKPSITSWVNPRIPNQLEVGMISYESKKAKDGPKDSKKANVSEMNKKEKLTLKKML